MIGKDPKGKIQKKDPTVAGAKIVLWRHGTHTYAKLWILGAWRGLGLLPNSPTPLLDLALDLIPSVEPDDIDTLRGLLRANKSFRVSRSRGRPRRGLSWSISH